MGRRLPVLCPQQYGEGGMSVTPCTHCSVGWNQKTKQCDVETGAEHLPRVKPEWIPDCGIAERCQHALQSSGPCPIRLRGMVCESALREMGVPDPESHKLSFTAECVASPEEVLEYLRCHPEERARLIDR
jgi:hypothetical protein